MRKVLWIASLIIAVALAVAGVMGVFGCMAQAQTESDSLAAAQQTGALEAPVVTEQYAANIGKAYSPRMLFIQTLPGTEGGGGGIPKANSGPYISSGQAWGIVGTLVVITAIVVFAGYGVYAIIRGVK